MVILLRRAEGRETFYRLLEWDKGQAASERLAALILEQEGFRDIDPSHPLGGKDGGKDMLCEFNGFKWIGAAYFPRGQQNFSAIKKKYRHDLEGAYRNGAKGIAFITNQELSLMERKTLEETDEAIDVRIYHLERIANILNMPKMYGIRLEYLEIEMTKEEQLAYFSYVNEQGITRIERKLDDLCENIRNRSERISVFNDTEEDEVRTLEEVLEAENMFFDKIWFDRHLSLEYRIEQGMEDVNPEIWQGAMESARKVIEKYGEENLGPYSDFEWGILNGKLSALRWVLGDEWDMLDT